MKHPESSISNSVEDLTLGPKHLAQTFSEEWFASDPQITHMEPPFKLRPENPGVHHVMVSQEYIIVQGDDPYQPTDIWEAELEKYKLPKQAEHNGVNVFEVPPDTVSLSAILNDSIDGDRDLFVDVFSEIGTMFRDIAHAYDRTLKRPITSAVTIDDIAFVKGRREPLLIPPFSLDIRATGESPTASIEADLHKTPLTFDQAAVIDEALVAFEEAYGRSAH